MTRFWMAQMSSFAANKLVGDELSMGVSVTTHNEIVLCNPFSDIAICDSDLHSVDRRILMQFLFC